MRGIFDRVGHYRSILRSAEEKLKNAQSAMSEHEHRKKPCEKCAEAEETGWGKAWHCDYYHTLTMRIEKYRGEVARARADLRRVEREESEEPPEGGEVRHEGNTG